MALLWIDGFEAYGTSIGSAPSPSGVCARKYSNVGSEANIDIVTGRFGGLAIELPVSVCVLVTPSLTTVDTLIAGIAFKSGTTTQSYMLSFYDGGTLGMNIRWETGGSEIEIYRGTSLIATSVGAGLQTSIWHYIELKVKCNNSTGTYEVHLDGNTVLSDSGIDTQAGSNAYHDVVRLRGSGTATFYDDFYICDNSGSDNNDFLGNCKVVAIFPDGDDTANWTTSTPSANHYENVDETIVDDDTSYVEEDTTAVTDLYDYEALPSLGPIKGIQINTDCRETDASTFDIEMPIESSGNQYDGLAITVGSESWVTRRRIEGTNPDTSSAWTDSEIDAAKFGIKVG